MVPDHALEDLKLPWKKDSKSSKHLEIFFYTEEAAQTI